MLFSLLEKLKRKLKSVFKKSNDYRNKDEIYLSLDGLEIVVNRYFAYDNPHEVSVFVPRAELRKTIKENNKIEETEILLNSITVVHSPQRPSDEGIGPPIKPPDFEEVLENKK